jgi:hypothetical protein
MCRRLHFIGSSLILLLIGYCINKNLWQGLWFIPAVGYGFAWLGHFIFEKNRPATLTYPVYSLIVAVFFKVVGTIYPHFIKLHLSAHYLYFLSPDSMIQVLPVGNFRPHETSVMD